MSNTRYIEINSAYRDRTQYPFPAEFVIPLAQSGQKTNSLTAYDPILDAYPFYPSDPLVPGILQAGTNPTTAVLDATASGIDNWYINDYLEQVGMPSVFSKIIFYNGGTKTATLETPIPGLAAGQPFRLRRSIPPVEQGVLAGGTLTTFTLPPTSSTIDNYYLGMYIWITSGAAAGNVRRITSYVGATKIGSVTVPFTASPAALDTYEILQFTRDNFCPLNYSGSLVSQQEMVCYEVECISLILPNTLLYSGVGGRIAFYPYVYLEFENLSAAGGHLKNIIYSNNPNATRVLFRCPIDDTQQPLNSTFVKIDSDGMKQTVKFKPNDNFFFRVTLPSGELFKTRPDNFSPLPPDPSIQISACFAIRRI